MPLHYLDETQRPRECPRCHGSGDDPRSLAPRDQACTHCRGRGRLGDAGARADVRTFDYAVCTYCGDTEAQHYHEDGSRREDSEHCADYVNTWHYAVRTSEGWQYNPGSFYTESAALDAARAAAQGER